MVVRVDEIRGMGEWAGTEANVMDDYQIKEEYLPKAFLKNTGGEVGLPVLCSLRLYVFYLNAIGKGDPKRLMDMRTLGVVITS